jgi:hypothetical protein
MTSNYPGIYLVCLKFSVPHTATAVGEYAFSRYFIFLHYFLAVHSLGPYKRRFFDWLTYLLMSSSTFPDRSL